MSKGPKTTSAKMPALSDHVGIDIGSTQTRLYAKQHGPLLQELSLVALSGDNQQDALLGHEALQALAQAPQAWVAVRPVKDGQMVDLPFTQFLAAQYLGRVLRHLPPLRASVAGHAVFALPFGQSPELPATLQRATQGIEVGGVHLVEKALACALGAGLPVSSGHGSMVVDLGGGSTTVAVLSLGGVVISRRIRAAGDEFNECIVRHFRRKHDVFVNERTAEEIKKTIGAAMLLHEQENRSAIVHGLDLVSGLTVTLQVDSIDVVEAISEPVQKIVQAVRRVLELTPSALLFDLMEKGLVLTGGSAQLLHFDELLHQATGLPVQVAALPDQATVRGSVLALEQTALLTRAGGFVSL